MDNKKKTWYLTGAMLAVLGTAIVTVCLLSPLKADSMPIVKDRKPVATIVIDARASGQVKGAAKLLQSCIQKSTGALLPISNNAKGSNLIHIGNTAYATQHVSTKGLDQEGYVLQGVDAQNYVIIGGSDWGTEFGVYEFLERYVGVRWLMPTDLGTDIPQQASLDVPATAVKQSPVYLSRRLSPMSVTSYDALNTWGRHNRARERLQFTHNLFRLFPPSQLGRSHPEFYATNARRKAGAPTSSSDKNWQPNFSAPGLADTAAARIIAYFKQNPGANSYSLGMNDSHWFDESPASKQLRIPGKRNYIGLADASDEYYTWANNVVAKVRKVYPDKLFGTLALSSVAEPPTRVKVDQHIVPFLTFEFLRWANPQTRSFLQKYNSQWAGAVPVQGWYDYAYGSQYMVPRVWPHTMQAYLSWGAAHQVKYYYAELYPNWGEGPKAWILAKLLWNPNQDVDALLNDWYTRVGGAKAAPKLKAFYEIWEKFWTTDIHSSKWAKTTWQYWPFTNSDYMLSVPSDYISRSDALMTEAVKLAQTPVQKARVAKLSQMWQFYKSAVATYKGSGGNQGLALYSSGSGGSSGGGAKQLPSILGNLQKDPLLGPCAKLISKRMGNDKKWQSKVKLPKVEAERLLPEDEKDQK